MSLKSLARIVIASCVISFLFVSSAFADPSQSAAALQKSGKATWTRLASDVALGTMMEIVDEAYAKDSCEDVIIATKEGYWDALTAAGLAGLYDCPVLMTDPFELSSETRYEIARIGASRAVIAGGTAAVTSVVEGELRDMGLATTRVWGQTAAATARSVYARGALAYKWGTTAIVATANGYWDAMAASPYSFAKHAPIFLAEVATSRGMKLDDETVETIKAGGFSDVIICGGTAAVASSVESQLSGLKVARMAGKDAVDTSRLIAERSIADGMTADGLAVATNNGFWDGLCGAALAGRENAPLLLMDIAAPAKAADGFVKAHSNEIMHGYIFGGTAAVPTAAETALKSAA
ncbi:MAG: cell wall-binding repeat-containing protein [Eggerthellaceae bacterium]|nr:cell wall-binding repeat-containing protein [Eggerthellaceae bacterium]